MVITIVCTQCVDEAIRLLLNLRLADGVEGKADVRSPEDVIAGLNGKEWISEFAIVIAAHTMAGIIPKPVDAVRT